MVTIQSQNFGVEIEMTGVSRGTAASVIANYFGVGGIHFAGGTYQTYEASAMMVIRIALSVFSSGLKLTHVSSAASTM